MSAWGFGGFANGFLQGFNTMGQEFARRGLLRRERETSARDDRRLALEEEIQRGAAQRADEEAALLNEQRQMNNDILRPQVPYAADAAARANEAGNLELQRSRLGVQETEADIKSKDIANQYAGQEKQANLAHTGAQTAYTQMQTDDAKLKTQQDRLLLEEQNQAVQARRDNSTAMRAFMEGKADPSQIKRVQLMAGFAGNDLEQVINTLDDAREKVKAGQGYNPMQDQKVIDAVNTGMGMWLNQTHGMAVKPPPEAKPQSNVGYRVESTRLVGFAPGDKDHPQTLIPILEVTAAPDNGQGQPVTYVRPLTRGRQPLDEGGEPWYLKPEDFYWMREQLGQAAAWQKKYPNEWKELARIQQELTLTGRVEGKRGVNKDQAELILKAREDERKTRHFQQETQSNKLKRLDDVIAKKYGAVTLDELTTLGGPNAERAAEERLEASRVLRENPGFDEDQIMAEVEKTLGANRKPGKTGKGGQDGTPTSDKLDRFLYKKGT